MPRFVQWPDLPAVAANSQKFEAISGVPGVLGAMHTTHIPIIAPKGNVAAYFNRRLTERNQRITYSVTIQGVVDPDGIITDGPGSMYDDQVLEKSVLYQRAAGGKFAKDSWVAGGVGYPLMDWLLVPYTHQNLTWTQHTFNEKVGEVTRVAKEAFARMKGRWGCLQKRAEVKLQDVPVVLGACCVLHNICKMRKEEMDPKMKFELVDGEVVVAENSLRSADVVQAREKIKTMLDDCRQGSLNSQNYAVERQQLRQLQNVWYSCTMMSNLACSFSEHSFDYLGFSNLKCNPPHPLYGCKRST